MMKKIAILGATGSIGKQVLDVLGDDYQIVLLSANQNGVYLRDAFSHLNGVKIVSNSTYEVALGDNNEHVFNTAVLNEPSTYLGIDVVVNGIGGIWGIEPSFAVLESGAKLITANKETFVACGYLFMERAKALGKKVGEDIIPIDSEHSAVWQCLRGEDWSSLEKVTLTASGGAFRDLSKEEISALKSSDALNHPT
ncbi:MAG: 1-deoxy-D-xylulose-5-phosphate reductoisomerase, partial [Clostridia bacterium]|nr:1-deoxy-D-xylulose-5-phosphate reductoisomerase [Clostridia bacterium]